MSDFEAFRLEVQEVDDGMPNGILNIQYIVIKRGLDQAVEAVRELRRKPCKIEVIGQGWEVAAEAARRGLREGDVTIL